MSEELLLTDDEILQCYRNTKFPIPHAVEKEICKAQLAKLQSHYASMDNGKLRECIRKIFEFNTKVTDEAHLDTEIAIGEILNLIQPMIAQAKADAVKEVVEKIKGMLELPRSVSCEVAPVLTGTNWIPVLDSDYNEDYYRISRYNWQQLLESK